MKMPSRSSHGKSRLLSLVVITCIASASLGVVLKVSEGLRSTGVHDSSSDSSSNNDSNNPVVDTGTVDAQHGKFHQSSLGGIYNIAHPAGARARHRLSNAHVIVPKSATPGAVQSVARENIENLYGHYVNDEHRSPFSSFLYDRPKEELDAEQDEYIEKMNRIRQEWGAWDFKDGEKLRPLADFSSTPHRDLSNSDFPANAWQMDQTYVTDLIAEGKTLIARIREGVYAEYGWNTKDLDEAKIQERNKLFEVHISEVSDHPPTTGFAWMNQKGFDMLVRKLLHAMITNDEFYIVLGGHSSAAGHGNHFHQQYTMQFANVMETVFHKLGMRLIAKNMAMGGLGTTHFSMGQSTLYGEKDFLMWDSSMTEKSVNDQDLFNKQGLLGGERVPILYGSHPSNLETETGGNLWYGNDIMNMDFVPLTTGIDQVEELPYAARYMHCDPSVGNMCGSRGMDKYHGSCWEPRCDVNITAKQEPFPGGRATWHGGDREHQIRSRKHIMLFLKAFDEAFQVWMKGIEDEGFPLKETYWHIGGHYTAARSALSSYINREDVLNTSLCEQRFAPHGLEKICRVKMSGMTEWTPRNNGDENGILRHVKAAPNGYKPHKLYEHIYEGVNVLPRILKLPKEEIDLHAIALVTTYTPAELDQSWVDDDDEDAEEAENSRRMLRNAAIMDKSPSQEGIVDSVKPEMLRERRTGSDDKVVPGIGWGHEDTGGESPTGYCDGSPMSMCKRGPLANCLLSGHNDARQTLAGNALSSWLVVTLPEVKEGFILAKLQWWSPRGEGLPQTRGWTEVNNGDKIDDESDRRLKAPQIPWPEDFEVDIALNGEIHKTFKKDEFSVPEIAYNEAFYKLVDDPNPFNGGPVELGIRIRSTEKQKDASFGITHIYWA